MYNLKRIREAAGLTQRELAERSGVPLRNIQVYEAESPKTHKNINGASALGVWNMAQVLGCQVIDILEVDNANPGSSNG